MLARVARGRRTAVNSREVLFTEQDVCMFSTHEQQGASSGRGTGGERDGRSWGAENFF